MRRVLSAAGIAAMLAAPSAGWAQDSRLMFRWTNLGNETKELVINGTTVIAASDAGSFRQTGWHTSVNTNYIVGACYPPPSVSCASGGTTYNNF
ncbi:MAG: hypothetical protein MUF00_06845 [Gemmatimonadaceae bacterium]|nr:hypothetical protein [Gemmatimonadaceae bacterium]